MNQSQRLGLPFIAPGQSQKELFHNEALQLLDLVAAAAVEEAPRNDPPEPPTLGSSYIVGAAPTGEWSGKAGALALYTPAGWRFVGPVEGMQALVKPGGTRAVYRSGGWELGTVRAGRVMVDGVQVVAAQAPAVADAAGGAIVDSEARSAINALLSALRSHGLIATE
jgi:hypothetical protein